MTSPHVLDQLPLWVGGDLDTTRAAEVEGHLATCATCRSTAEQLKTSQAWLRDAMAPPFTTDHRDHLRRVVMDQVRAEAAVRSTHQLAIRRNLLAACAASLLLATLVWRQQRGTRALAPRLLAPPLSQVGKGPSQPDPQPFRTEPRLASSAQARPHSAPGRSFEPPPLGQPARIEFQTADPTIRIIWLTQAKTLPEPHPSPEEKS
jgi:anti-sigma factor RsiW